MRSLLGTIARFHIPCDLVLLLMNAGATDFSHRRTRCRMTSSRLFDARNVRTQLALCDDTTDEGGGCSTRGEERLVSLPLRYGWGIVEEIQTR